VVKGFRFSSACREREEWAREPHLRSCLRSAFELGGSPTPLAPTVGCGATNPSIPNSCVASVGLLRSSRRGCTQRKRAERSLPTAGGRRPPRVSEGPTPDSLGALELRGVCFLRSSCVASASWCGRCVRGTARCVGAAWRASTTTPGERAFAAVQRSKSCES
jgi:hypothetical protein